MLREGPCHFLSILTVLTLAATSQQILNGNQAPPVERQKKAADKTAADERPEQPAAPSRVTIDGPVTVVNKPDPKQEEREAEQRAQTKLQNWINGITLVLLGLATAGAWAAYVASRRSAIADEEQARLLKRQVDIASSARVYEMGVTATNFAPGKEPVFFLHIANAGPVPAENVKVYVSIVHANGHTLPAQENSILIPANGFRDYDVRASFLLPNDLTELDGWNLKVLGSITHATGIITFCYKYNHWAERPAGVPMFVPCDFDHRRHVAVTAQPGRYNLSGHAPSLSIEATDPQKNDGRE
jgi:hypothetical protein